MVTLTLAEMQTQLTEVVRGAVERGFELVAGVVGAKLAKSMEAAVENAETICKGGGFDEVAGLREQIKDNAIILLPLMHARGRSPTRVGAVQDPEALPNINIITSGPTGGMRAMLVESSPTTPPHLVFWSSKHATAATALKDLLEVTQLQLKIFIAALVDPPSPATDTGDAGWTRLPHPTTFKGTPPDLNATATSARATARAGRVSTQTRNNLFWDAAMTTNPSFASTGGFDYGSFDSDSSSTSDDATYVEPSTEWATA